MKKENSFKYLSTILQLAGIASATPVSNAIFRKTMGVNTDTINYGFCLCLFLMSILFLATGWYITYIIDKDELKYGDK